MTVMGACALVLLAALLGATAQLTQASPIIGATPVGTTPIGIAVDAHTQRAFVVNNGDDSVDVLDTRSGALLRTVTVGDGPTGLTVDERGGRVIVIDANTNASQQTGQFFLLRPQWSGLSALSLLDARDGRPLRTIVTATSLAGAAVDKVRHRVVVSKGDDPHPGAGSIDVLGDAPEATRPLATLPGTLLALAVDGRAGRVIVASDAGGGTVSVIDAASGRLVRRNAIGPVLPGQSIAVDERHGRAFVLSAKLDANAGSIAVLDTRSGRLLRTVALDSAPAAIAVDESTDHVFVSTIGAATTSAIVPGYRPWWRTLAAPVSRDRGHVVMLDARSGAVLHSSAVGIAPGALAVDAARHHLVVATVGAMDGAGVPTGRGALSVLDTRSGAVLRTVAVGVDPGDVAVDERAARILVLNFGGMEDVPDRWSWLPSQLRSLLPFLPRPPSGPQQARSSVTVLDAARL